MVSYCLQEYYIYIYIYSFSGLSVAERQKRITDLDSTPQETFIERKIV